METQIFFADVTDIDYDRYFNLMPVERQKRTEKFRFEKDKKLSVGAWGLLENALAVNGIDSVGLYKGKHGKLYSDKDNFFFNLSHSEKMVMCAVSQKEIGCDVERIKKVDLKLADRFFTKNERSIVTDDKSFFRLWTLKESFIKCTGKGLTIPLNSFDISLSSPPKITQAISFKEYFLKEFAIDKDYCFSACCESEIKGDILRVIL